MEVLRYLWRDNDEQKLFPEIVDAYKKIQEYRSVGKNVLVICYKGMSRSSSMILFTLCMSRKISVEEALERLRSRRNAAQPQRRFIDQIEEYIRNQ